MREERNDMKSKESKPKVGLSRLMELSGSYRKQLIGACILSVLSAAARLVPFLQFMDCYSKL